MKKLLALLLILSNAISLNTAYADAQRKPGDYQFTTDSLQQAGVPNGTLKGPYEFHSKIFKNTVRRYWVYLPANYEALHQKPLNLLVFQDGQRATNPNGSLRVPEVLDNLIHQKAIPPTIGLFITPGNSSETYPDDLGMSNPDRRAQEYDSLNDNYARMLLEELLPQLEKTYAISSNPQDRIIGGTSSGAICAFTVAWNKPDAFHNVISIIGSYTSIGYQPATADKPMAPGGDLYPGLIRKSSIRPLKIFLQDGSNDLDNEHGNWFLSNQQMLAALLWANKNADEKKDKGARYEVRHVWGDGDHSDKHGGVLLPEILRWMWGKYSAY
ncbi:alpha/beta hydrolase [Cellvibrio mixtus]|uniref:alpha/beta hydrolase n=1 Tax=Cellvibrio mixtus TaxID=39650 RepID=UPI000587E54E|nr:alpha/beta hydrolase-fold protein [Cellvibrio mixtus]